MPVGCSFSIIIIATAFDGKLFGAAASASHLYHFDAKFVGNQNTNKVKSEADP